jgi:hypothetical protein|uniref:Uncharacterized protein n=1 Tax=Eutreptiella gymnastica TaxID=73025 RepID=A0A7S4GII9_9EUGL
MQVDEEGPAKPRRILKVKRNAASAGVKREVPADPIPQMDFRPQKEKPPPEKKQKSNEGKAKARPQKRKLFKVGEKNLPTCPRTQVSQKPITWGKKRVNKMKDRMKGRFRNITLRPGMYDAAFEKRTKKKWGFTAFRNTYGCYAVWEHLVDYFQGSTPDPNDFVRRNMKMGLNLQERFKTGRLTFNRDIRRICQDNGCPEIVKSAMTLKQVQADSKFRQIVEDLCSVPADEVCPLTQAYIVWCIRHNFKGGDWQEELEKFAEIEVGHGRRKGKVTDNAKKASA